MIESQKDKFECRLRQGDWWKEGNECLNVSDINKVPSYFSGTEKEWIEQLTAFIYINPREWTLIYEQYLHNAIFSKESVLQFYRNDEGYLRMIGMDDVYLKVTGYREWLSHDVLECIGQVLSRHEEELFWIVVECGRNGGYHRPKLIERIKENVLCYIKGVRVSASVVNTLDESDFLGRELYFDMLNNLYIIL